MAFKRPWNERTMNLKWRRESNFPPPLRHLSNIVLSKVSRQNFGTDTQVISMRTEQFSSPHFHFPSGKPRCIVNSFKNGGFHLIFILIPLFPAPNFWHPARNWICIKRVTKFQIFFSFFRLELVWLERTRKFERSCIKGRLWTPRLEIQFTLGVRD